MQIKPSASIRQMLADNIRFVAQKSPAAAREVKNALMESIRSLKEIPERFPFLEAELSHLINTIRCS